MALSKRSCWKRRCGEDVHEDRHRLLEVLGEHVEARRSGDVADVGAEVGGEEIELLVELLGGALAGATGPPGGSGDTGQTLLAGGHEVAPAVEVDGDVDERKLLVLFGVDRGAILELEAERVGVRHVKCQLGELQLSGRSGISAAESRGGGDQNEKTVRIVVRRMSLLLSGGRPEHFDPFGRPLDDQLDGRLELGRGLALHGLHLLQPLLEFGRVLDLGDLGQSPVWPSPWPGR